MKSIFKSKPKNPSDLVRQTRDLLVSLDLSGTEVKESRRDEKIMDLSELIQELKQVLYGNCESEPVAEACAQLTSGRWKGGNKKKRKIKGLTLFLEEHSKEMLLLLQRLTHQFQLSFLCTLGLTVVAGGVSNITPVSVDVAARDGSITKSQSDKVDIDQRNFNPSRGQEILSAIGAH